MAWPRGSQAGDPLLGLIPSRLLQTLCTKATMQTVRAADTNEIVKLIFRESDNDRKVTRGRLCAVPELGRGDHALSHCCLLPPAPTPCHWQVMLQLEKKLFEYFNQEVFRDDNGTAVSPASAVPPMPPWPRFLVLSQPRGPLLNRPSLLEITQHLATVLLRGLPQLSCQAASGPRLLDSPESLPHPCPPPLTCCRSPLTPLPAPSPPSAWSPAKACHSPTGRG